MSKKEENIKWVKITDFNLIPNVMLDRVKKEGLEGKLLYHYSDKIFEDQSNILHAFVDKKSKAIEGFIWSSITILDMSLTVNLFYVKPKHKEEVSKSVQENLYDIKKELKLKKVLWATTKPEELEKIGFTKSDRVLMELSDTDKEE